MNTDFAKLLNNCMNRMDGKDDDTYKNDDGRDTIGEKVEIFGTNSSPVRSEIKDIIEEKIKQKDTNVGSPVLEKVGPIQLGGSDYDVELEEASGQATPEKAKILFSLKGRKNRKTMQTFFLLVKSKKATMLLLIAIRM